MEDKQMKVIVVICLLVVLLIAGYVETRMLSAGEQSSQPLFIPAVKVDAPAKGNFTYIPLELGGSCAKNMDNILTALNVWEKSNPERAVLSFDLICQQQSFATGDRTIGVVIHSKPR